MAALVSRQVAEVFGGKVGGARSTWHQGVQMWVLQGALVLQRAALFVPVESQGGVTWGRRHRKWSWTRWREQSALARGYTLACALCEVFVCVQCSMDIKAVPWSAEGVFGGIAGPAGPRCPWGAVAHAAGRSPLTGSDKYVGRWRHSASKFDTILFRL